MTEEIQGKLEVLKMYGRRKQKLELQLAQFGAGVDPSIPIEIEDITHQINRLQYQIFDLTQGDKPKKEAFDTKHYLYVSEAKINMLYSQLIQTPNEATLFSKARFVVEQLDENLSIGTVDDPKIYFRGNLPMYWGSFSSDRFGKVGVEIDEVNSHDLIFWGGITERTRVGLIGSLKYVIGSKPVEPMVHYRANLGLLAAIANEMNKPTSDKEVVEALQSIFLISQYAWGFEQNLEFVAKRMLTHQEVLIGSPLYVALVN